MFHLYIATLYLVPGLYVYLRLRRFFPERRHRDMFTVFYSLFLLIFPAVEMLSHATSLPEITTLLKTLNYSMPYLLYLFMSVILFDSFLLVRFLFKLLPKTTFENTRFKKTAITLIFTLPALVVIGGIINHNIIRIKEYSISVPPRSSSIAELKIAYAADFHIRGRSDRAFMDKFLYKVNSLRPDIVLLGGDILEGDRNDIDMSYFIERFREIKSKYGVFAVLGNHEFHGGKVNLEFFKLSGIHVLRDETINIHNSFCLAGRKDLRDEGRRELEGLMPKNRNLPVIVLDHRPIDELSLIREKADIVLSGHTHNGQLFPLNFFVAGLYHLSYGYKKSDMTNFFVTSGLQTWGPAVRTAGASEILMLDVKFK